MHEIGAERFLKIHRGFFVVGTTMRQGKLVGLPDETWDSTVLRKSVADMLNVIASECEELGLVATRDSVRRVIADMEVEKRVNNLGAQDIDLMIQASRGVFEDESKRCHILFLDSAETKLYNDPLQGFGNASSMFPSASYDLEEASKCLVLERGTASVFHLMRVLELATEAVWLSLRAVPQRKSTLRGWGDFRVEIDDYIGGKSQSGYPPDWRQKEPFYQEVHADLTSVYRAWRNPTMHMEKTYTTAQARKIMDATRALLADLAQHVDEQGSYIP